VCNNNKNIPLRHSQTLWQHQKSKKKMTSTIDHGAMANSSSSATNQPLMLDVSYSNID
jgi:hypothetical protein